MHPLQEARVLYRTNFEKSSVVYLLALYIPHHLYFTSKCTYLCITPRSLVDYFFSFLRSVPSCFLSSPFLSLCAIPSFTDPFFLQSFNVKFFFPSLLQAFLHLLVVSYAHSFLPPSFIQPVLRLVISVLRPSCNIYLDLSSIIPFPFSFLPSFFLPLPFIPYVFLQPFLH